MADDLIQQIVVHGEGSHEDVVYAAIEACLDCYRCWSEDEAYQEWLKGRFTKTVRVAKTKGIFEEILKSPFKGYGFHKRVSAAAFIPAVLDRTTFLAKKTQVSGLNREKTGWIPGWGCNNVIAINPTVEMTTGKTAAQVCHAALAMRMKDPTFFEKNWTIVENPNWYKAVSSTKNAINIRDAGYTEIDPGTLTVAAAVI